MSTLTVENLTARHGLLEAVRGLSFSIAKGETLALVGANGAGKTTLMRTLAGAHAVHGGRIMLDGEDVTALPAHQRVRRGISLVPEGRRMFASMTVSENLKLGAMADRTGDWSIERIIEIFPNLRKRLDHKTGHLSGGEQQATAIGRALMSNPDILLLDEVSLGLSPLIVDRVYASLEGLIASGTTIILVEQDLTRAMSVADRVICMLEGKAVLEGRATDLTREQVTEAYFGLKRATAGRAHA
ncbi:ABC transporter ATP-binding protein [Agrobacterium leguminum]|uniref:ABC transporter ATP-binding protein n=1 Tax=Agrobacterium tumefaciens TaxID=358 RepID=A0A546XJ77_AGRTU|nr:MULTISPECIES: ABC transporter ATP-binding protein [Rhizobiaceae]MCZ7934822.1 ABC transporter ATP-binding protein [Agrobacterium leguminum]MEB3046176.1 ABC transporter ATP-binding protein [Rhizobium sp. MJ21]NOV19227.1 ABC transporter ATP-binding protein [Ensifer canadensis]NSX94114.1 ABC transporter ATP-binding protein [Agrobacterium tumefaciens]NTA35458.1 ABC transporter ATP-binding protein [Agrobacterium salinitolerans]